jgi:hypothetical protein
MMLALGIFIGIVVGGVIAVFAFAWYLSGVFRR